MGVHDTPKYGEVRRILGISEGEPLFILRAQDVLAVRTVENYRRTYIQQAMIDQVPIEEQDRFAADLDHAILEIMDWQEQHQDQVKFPD